MEYVILTSSPIKTLPARGCASLCTCDFNPADIEDFFVFDKVVCHCTILSSINGQFRKISKLLVNSVKGAINYHFAVAACVVPVVVCGDDTRQLDFARLNFLLENRQHTAITYIFSLSDGKAGSTSLAQQDQQLPIPWLPHR
jgi:hypothetical protein